MKEKINAAQEIGVANRVLDGQTAMGLAGLDGRVELLEKQGRFLLDQQEQESNVWHNVAFNLCEEILEGEGKIAHLQDLLDIQRKSNQQLCVIACIFKLSFFAFSCLPDPHFRYLILFLITLFVSTFQKDTNTFSFGGQLWIVLRIAG